MDILTLFTNSKTANVPSCWLILTGSGSGGGFGETNFQWSCSREQTSKVT